MSLENNERGRITDERVKAFIDGCKKREPDCLDNGDFAICENCSRILLEIAAEVLEEKRP